MKKMLLMICMIMLTAFGLKISFSAQTYLDYLEIENIGLTEV